MDPRTLLMIAWLVSISLEVLAIVFSEYLAMETYALKRSNWVRIPHLLILGLLSVTSAATGVFWIILTDSKTTLSPFEWIASLFMIANVMATIVVCAFILSALEKGISFIQAIEEGDNNDQLRAF